MNAWAQSRAQLERLSAPELKAYTAKVGLLSATTHSLLIPLFIFFVYR